MALQETTASTSAQRKSLTDFAAQKGFKLVAIPADGNCALHAIAHQLYLQGIQTDAKTLRHQVALYLQQHQEIIDENFLLQRRCIDVGSYLNNVAADGTWVDEVTLRAVAQRIEREIQILHANGHTTILTPQEIAHSNSESIAINVGQIGEVHYVSLQSITNFDDNYVSAQPQNEETQSDRRGWYLRQPTEPAFASWKMRQYRVKADG